MIHKSGSVNSLGDGGYEDTHLADPQPVQPEEDGESGVGVVEALSGEEEGAELGVVQDSGQRLRLLEPHERLYTLDYPANSIPRRA